MVLLFQYERATRPTDNGAIAHFPDSGHESNGLVTLMTATKV